MPLSYDFKKMMRARAQADPKFRLAVLREAVECLLAATSYLCERDSKIS